MDISAQFINDFLKVIGRHNQFGLTLRRFRGRFDTGGNCEEYYYNILLPHKVEVYERGLELAKLAKSYHNFKDRRLLDHDMSKLSKAEMAYSEINLEDIHSNSSKTLNRFRDSWHHHKSNNTHHPEYWFSVNKSGQTDILPMPHDDILEMVANWMGQGVTLKEYIGENLPNYVFHKDTAHLLQGFLKKLDIDTKIINNKLFSNAKILK